MKKLEQYIESGVLDLYVTGVLPVEEQIEISKAARQNPELQAEIDSLRKAYELLGEAQAIQPPSSSKARFLANLDALESSEAEFNPEKPPVLNPNSRPEDYDFWVNLDIAKTPETYDDLFFVPIADNDDGLTAVVWINGIVEEEEHLDAIEKFLVLEGSCMIDIEGDITYLKAGDQLSIPKFKSHNVKVTSEIPCKLIVQRIAA